MTALKRLESILSDERAALASPDGFHLYHNAMRREAQGKFDMASLLLYRLLEWISQHRLASYGLITGEPDYGRLKWDREAIAKRFNEKSQEVFRKGREFPLPDKIGLMEGYILLWVLGDAIAEDIPWRAFQGQLESRNHNLFAHGFKKIADKSYEAFKTTVAARFDKAQAIAGIDAEALSQQHEFMDPFGSD